MLFNVIYDKFEYEVWCTINDHKDYVAHRGLSWHIIPIKECVIIKEN